MSWREFGQLTLLLLGINLIGVGIGAAWEWVAVGVFLLVVAAVSWRSRRSWKQRMERLRRADPSSREEELATLSADDRVAARLWLDQVGSHDARVDPQVGETFYFKKTPKGLRIGVMALTLLMAGLPTVLLILGEVAPDQKLPAALVGFGFACSAFVLSWSWSKEDASISITASGIQELRADGRRIGILWSEIVWVRNRRWLMALEVYAGDGRRRIRIWYTLQGFSRMVELLTAHLKWAEERFGRTDVEVSGEHESTGA